MSGLPGEPGAAACNRPAKSAMSKTLSRSSASRSSRRSTNSVPSPASCKTWATYWLRGLSRPLPLPCAKRQLQSRRPAFQGSTRSPSRSPQLRDDPVSGATGVSCGRDDGLVSRPDRPGRIRTRGAAARVRGHRLRCPRSDRNLRTTVRPSGSAPGKGHRCNRRRSPEFVTRRAAPIGTATTICAGSLSLERQPPRASSSPLPIRRRPRSRFSLDLYGERPP